MSINFNFYNPSVTALPCHLPLHKGGYHININFSVYCINKIKTSVFNRGLLWCDGYVHTYYITCKSKSQRGVVQTPSGMRGTMSRPLYCADLKGCRAFAAADLLPVRQDRLRRKKKTALFRCRFRISLSYVRTYSIMRERSFLPVGASPLSQALRS